MSADSWGSNIERTTVWVSEAFRTLCRRNLLKMLQFLQQVMRCLSPLNFCCEPKTALRIKLETSSQFTYLWINIRGGLNTVCICLYWWKIGAPEKTEVYVALASLTYSWLCQAGCCSGMCPLRRLWGSNELSIGSVHQKLVFLLIFTSIWLNNNNIPNLEIKNINCSFLESYNIWNLQKLYSVKPYFLTNIWKLVL